MKNLFATSFLLLALPLALIGTGAQAQAPRGQVHNEKAAILMARKIWINLYPVSAAKVGSEAAWLKGEKATLDGDMWEVSPKTPGPDALGSGLVFRIASVDGKMMGYYSP
jgi:hypothetical protein